MQALAQTNLLEKGILFLTGTTGIGFIHSFPGIASEDLSATRFSDMLT